MNVTADAVAASTHLPAAHRRVRPFAAGMALSCFFLITFLAASLLYAVIPDAVAMKAVFNEFLPGVEDLGVGYLLLGAIVAVAWGWYIALVMVPLYNYFVARD